MARPEQPRAKALHELLSHHMVDIYVGPSNTHWILHEKLLCAKSNYFNQLFFNKNERRKAGSSPKTFGLPDEDDEPFTLFVGWLYSERVPAPTKENDLTQLLDLYLMAEKWQIADLVRDVLGAVREWYRKTDTFPGLRRVQYVYANTDEDSPLRQLLVHSVARMLVLGEQFPTHWEKALRKNGELALDIIQAVRSWEIDPENVPDAREQVSEEEKSKVKEVAEAEKKQTGVEKGQQEGEEGEAEPEEQHEDSDDETLANLTNGISADDDEDAE